LGGSLYGSEISIIVTFVVLAGITKIVQIPFSAWLPAAMAAPTPVSALVHSSTLVTAGVYLLIRFSNVLTDSFVGRVLLLLSDLTMFIAGSGTNYEYNLGKITALFTFSLLGLIIMILSIGFSILAFSHLLTHGIFGPYCFYAQGHGVGDTQDIRCIILYIKYH